MLFSETPLAQIVERTNRKLLEKQLQLANRGEELKIVGVALMMTGFNLSRHS